MKSEQILRIAAAVFLLAGTACGGSSDEADGDLPLEQCLPGMWMNKDAETDCRCDIQETPECGQPGCTDSNGVWVARPDGTLRDFRMRFIDAANGTLSVLGTPAVGRWEVVSPGVVDRRYEGSTSPTTYPMTCSGAQMRWSGQRFHRAPDHIREAIERTWDDEEQIGVAY